MKKKYIGIISGVAVAAIVLVLLFAVGTGGNASNNSTDATNTTPEEPPVESNWISPGKFYVENYEVTHMVELILQVHNGNAVPTEFSVDFRWPDGLTEGYVKPTGASDWVKVKEKFPTIGAHETYEAKIWLHMPALAVPPGDKWEFWIGVIDRSQTGMVQVELCSRVLVTMK